MTSNVAGALSYIFPVGIIFLAIDPYKGDPFVRFHSFQAIFYWVGAFVIRFALALMLPWTLWSIVWLVSLAIFGGWVFLVFKAYNNERFKFPVIGDIAEKQAGA